MLVTYFLNFRLLNDHLFGKELFIRFTASAFRKLPSIYIFSYFPFGFEGRIWDLIVSVPDHCLSFYFADPADADDVVTKRYVASPFQALSDEVQGNKSKLCAFLNLLGVVNYQVLIREYEIEAHILSMIVRYVLMLLELILENIYACQIILAR